MASRSIAKTKYSSPTRITIGFRCSNISDRRDVKIPSSNNQASVKLQISGNCSSRRREALISWVDQLEPPDVGCYEWSAFCKLMVLWILIVGCWCFPSRADTILASKHD